MERAAESQDVTQKHIESSTSTETGEASFLSQRSDGEVIPVLGLQTARRGGNGQEFWCSCIAGSFLTGVVLACAIFLGRMSRQVDEEHHDSDGEEAAADGRT